MSNGCSETLRVSVADAYRSIAVAVFGTGARDKMHLAEMSVLASIADISTAEEKTKTELGALARRVREMDPVKQRGQMQEILGRSRMLRGTLANMGKKRVGMEQHLETLRQSQLNQNMLMSMKHTSDALQTLGLKVSDADNIMLDLEDTTSDSHALTTTLSTNFMEHTLSYDDLEAELALMMSEDALCAVPLQQPTAARVAAAPEPAPKPTAEPAPEPAAPAPEPAPEPAAPAPAALPALLPIPEGDSDEPAADSAAPDARAQPPSTEAAAEAVAEGPV
jgi:hypothetical protein